MKSQREERQMTWDDEGSQVRLFTLLCSMDVMSLILLFFSM